MKKIAGIFWYNDEIAYRQARSIFKDAFNMPDTYKDWKAGVKTLSEKFKREGWTLVRAEFNPDTFPAWCEERGLNIDAKARMSFGDYVAGEYLRTGKGVIIDI